MNWSGRSGGAHSADLCFIGNVFFWVDRSGLRPAARAALACILQQLCNSFGAWRDAVAACALPCCQGEREMRTVTGRLVKISFSIFFNLDAPQLQSSEESSKKSSPDLRAGLLN